LTTGLLQIANDVEHLGEVCTLLETAILDGQGRDDGDTGRHQSSLIELSRLSGEHDFS
jgi:hypothetical protein